jgi:hypothetical protein
MSFFLRRLGVGSLGVSATIPIVIALTLSIFLAVISLLAAERRLTRFKSD